MGYSVNLFWRILQGFGVHTELLSETVIEFYSRVIFYDSHS
jgi:hypothetical protein